MTTMTKTGRPFMVEAPPHTILGIIEALEKITFAVEDFLDDRIDVDGLGKVYRKVKGAPEYFRSKLFPNLGISPEAN